MGVDGNTQSTGIYDLVSIDRVPGGFGVTFLLPQCPLHAPRWGDSVAGHDTDGKGVTRGFLYTPNPDPGSVTLLGIGMACLAACGWKRRTGSRAPKLQAVP
jgi:hypothetical protein